MTKESKTRSSKRIMSKIVIIAAIISLLAVTVSAAEYVGGWFSQYFSDNMGKPMTDSQMDYIAQHSQPTVALPIVTEGHNGYSLDVRSALTDGKIAYITVGITAPEDVSLEEGEIRFLENPLLFPEGDVNGLMIAPDGSSPDAMCDYSTIDDGDGLSNTASIVFRVVPFKENEEVTPFDGSIHWRLYAEGFEKSVFDDEKMEFIHTPLGDGTWEFDLQFEPIDTRQVEFVSEPIKMKASPWLNDTYTIDCVLSSFTLSGLGFGMTFTTEFQAEEDDLLDIGDITIVMKDGTSTTLLRVTCPNTGTSPLGAPIVLNEVDHIRFRDGTTLYPIS